MSTSNIKFFAPVNIQDLANISTSSWQEI